MSEIEDIESKDYRVLGLVRLAIASEYNKKGLKRDEIYDKVCSTMRKAPVFEKVFELANEYLDENFAFKLVPLPFLGDPVVVSAKTNQSRKAAVNRMNKASNSKTTIPQMFILTSTLTSQQKAMLPRANRDSLRLAIIQAILMIIKLSGNIIEHQHLITALNEIQMCRTDSRGLAQKDLESFMEQLKREKYIVKEKKNQIENESVYSWGPRAFIEFPSENMAEFLFQVASTNNKNDVEPRFKEKALRVLKLSDIS